MICSHVRPAVVAIVLFCTQLALGESGPARAPLLDVFPSPTFKSETPGKTALSNKFTPTRGPWMAGLNERDVFAASMKHTQAWQSFSSTWPKPSKLNAGNRSRIGCLAAVSIHSICLPTARLCQYFRNATGSTCRQTARSYPRRSSITSLICSGASCFWINWKRWRSHQQLSPRDETNRPVLPQ